MTYTPYVFTPFLEEDKKRFLDDYLVHLHRRNGQADLQARRFSARENFFIDLEANPVRRSGLPVVNQVVFERNERTYRPELGLDQQTLWALAVAKSNRSERDGVEYALAHIDPSSRRPDDHLTYVEIEEFYHTRVLGDVLDVLGLEMHLLPPHPVTRLLLRSIVDLPKPVSNVMVLCAEVAGVAAFRLLRDKAQELFFDQPKPLERINELFQQILVDEVGHVHYVRSQLGPARLKLAQMMLPAFSKSFMSDMPEYKLLFGAEKLRDTIVTADVDSAVTNYPDKFIPVYS